MKPPAWSLSPPLVAYRAALLAASRQVAAHVRSSPPAEPVPGPDPREVAYLTNVLRPLAQAIQVANSLIDAAAQQAAAQVAAQAAALVTNGGAVTSSP